MSISYKGIEYWTVEETNWKTGIAETTLRNWINYSLSGKEGEWIEGKEFIVIQDATSVLGKLGGQKDKLFLINPLTFAELDPNEEYCGAYEAAKFLGITYNTFKRRFGSKFSYVSLRSKKKSQYAALYAYSDLERLKQESLLALGADEEWVDSKTARKRLGNISRQALNILKDRGRIAGKQSKLNQRWIWSKSSLDNFLETKYQRHR